MAQYRKDIYNLAPGLGMAVGDPREDEARAREASSRADQELALRRMQIAQSQALAQREMTLNESRAAFEQSLASQARGGGMPAYGDGQAAAPAGRAGPNVPMGRDAMSREAHVARAVQDILTGGQEARGMAYNTRNAPKTGVRVFDQVPGRSPAVGLTARQATFDPNGTGMIGDLGNLDFQQAIQNVLGEKAKLGLQRDEFKSQDTARRRAGDLADKSFKETQRANSAQEALQRLGVLAQQAQIEQTQNQQQAAHMADVGSQAAAWVAQNLPNRASGEVPQAVRMDLAEMSRNNPELARAIVDSLNTNEMRARVDQGARSMWRPDEATLRTLGLFMPEEANTAAIEGLNWANDQTGFVFTDEQAQRKASRDLARTLSSIIRPDGSAPTNPYLPQGTKAQEALREALARYGAGR